MIDEESHWLRFTYREFYDVPRMIIVELDDALMLLVSSFSDEDGDYARHYKAFVLPPNVDLAGSWVGLPESAASYLGTIDVEAVEFDETRRRAIKRGSLTPMISQLHRQ